MDDGFLKDALGSSRYAHAVQRFKAGAQPLGACRQTLKDTDSLDGEKSLACSPEIV